MSQVMSTVLNEGDSFWRMNAKQDALSLYSFMHSWISFTELALYPSEETSIHTELRLKAAWECRAAKLNITHATS